MNVHEFIHQQRRFNPRSREPFVDICALNSDCDSKAASHVTNEAATNEQKIGHVDEDWKGG